MATITILLDNGKDILVTDVEDTDDFMKVFYETQKNRETFQINYDGDRKVILLPGKVTSIEIID